MCFFHPPSYGRLLDLRGVPRRCLAWAFQRRQGSENGVLKGRVSRKQRHGFRRAWPFSRVPHVLVPTWCRADLGWIFYFCLANFRKIAGEFLSESWRRILIANFSALFYRASGHPKNSRPKFTSRIVGTPLQFHFLNPKFISGLSKRSFWKTVVLSPAENRWFWRKLAKILILHSTHKNKGFCSSDPRNRRKWRKWRVSPQQNDRLPKAPFWQPWLFTAIFCLRGRPTCSL